MADIFSQTDSAFGGSFTADSAQLTFGTNAGTLAAGLLVQQLQMQYAQAVTRLFEVGARRVYYVGGRTQGNASLARVVGPGVLLLAYYQAFGDLCLARGNTIRFSLNNRCVEAGVQNRGTYISKFCVITQVGFAVGAQDMVVNENSGLMFSSLEYTEGAAAAQTTFV